MKKASSVLLIVLLAVAMMFAMAACSNDQPTEGDNVVNENVDENVDDNAEATAPAGKYVIGTIIDAEGTEMSITDYLSAALIAQGYEEGSTEYELGMQAAETSYTFNEDGSVVAATLGQEVAGNYTVDGTSVTINFDVEGMAPISMEYNSEANTLSVADATTGLTTVMVADK